MKFEPRSREELNNLLPKGEYKAMVQSAEEKQSSSGNPMIVLKLEIYDDEGNKRIITDRLILIESMMWKLYDFCESAGIMDRYDAGDVSAYNCMDKSVHCKVVQKEAEGDFPAKNEIKSYFLPKSSTSHVPAAAPVKRAAPKNSPVSSKTGDDVDVPF
jgi:hypothetical protein